MLLRKCGFPGTAGGSDPQKSQTPRDVFEKGEMLRFLNSALISHATFMSLSRLPDGTSVASAWTGISQSRLFSQPQMMLCA